MHRASIALICVVDDAGESGEWFRVRKDCIVVGRAEGDIVIPHDDAISSRHFELARVYSGGTTRWYVNDLKSTNGTFARVSYAALRHGQEILIGSRRYRFELSQDAAASNARDSAVQQTRNWQSVTPEQLKAAQPALVELTESGELRRILLEKEKTWIGNDATQCGIAIADDPFVSPKHAKVYRNPRGAWYVQNGKSLNGTWVRFDRLQVESSGEFQAGEQRFLIKVQGREEDPSHHPA